MKSPPIADKRGYQPTTPVTGPPPKKPHPHGRPLTRADIEADIARLTYKLIEAQEGLEQKYRWLRDFDDRELNNRALRPECV